MLLLPPRESLWPGVALLMGCVEKVYHNTAYWRDQIYSCSSCAVIYGTKRWKGQF
jgi:hypothetical protein